MLPPANTVKINVETQLKHNSWWDYNFTEPDNSISLEEATIETERLLSKAVAKQMIADVPVGSYLSGGMDSGSLTAIASQQVKRLTTFTAGFDMSSVTGVEANYDERVRPVNPVRHDLILQCDIALPFATVQLYDLGGRCVLQQETTQLPQGRSMIAMDDTLLSGLYLLCVRSGDVQWRYKVMITD